MPQRWHGPVRAVILFLATPTRYESPHAKIASGVNLRGYPPAMTSVRPVPALSNYAAEREVHAHRRQHLDAVEADLAKFWASSKPAPDHVASGGNDPAWESQSNERGRQAARLMDEQSAARTVEAQAYERLVHLAVAAIPELNSAEQRAEAQRLIAAWPEQEVELLRIDCNASEISTAHREVMSKVFAIIDQEAKPIYPFLNRAK